MSVACNVLGRRGRRGGLGDAGGVAGAADSAREWRGGSQRPQQVLASRSLACPGVSVLGLALLSDAACVV